MSATPILSIQSEKYVATNARKQRARRERLRNLGIQGIYVELHQSTIEQIKAVPARNLSEAVESIIKDWRTQQGGIDLVRELMAIQNRLVSFSEHLNAEQSSRLWDEVMDPIAQLKGRLEAIRERGEEDQSCL